MDQKTQNIKENLVVQINKIFNNTREGGYKTRARYQEACKRFAGFLAQEFKLQKFTNIKGKHIVAYVKHMQAEGKSPDTIKTDLSGIRYAHNKGGGRNRLPDNDKLNLEERSYGKVDKAWTKEEIQMAKERALSGGRMDVYHAINIATTFGARIEGATTVRVKDLRNALRFDELRLKEKGGVIRYVPLTNLDQLKVIQDVLDYAESKGKTGLDKVLPDNFKGGVETKIRSIQSWIYNHRKHFQDDSIRNKKDFEAFKEKAERLGCKPKSECITFHGLRYHYAQNRFQELKAQGYSNQMAKRIVSENLGHHRSDVTNIYLSEKQ